jgi:D-serine deaminase-like pyridoxal phosphate-dependent protein
MPLQQPTLEASTATLVAHAMYAEILRVGHTCMMRLQQSYKALQGGRKCTEQEAESVLTTTQSV